jgi:2-oxoglutarate ferredoxin oxidoreductase subunit beta
MRRNVNMLYILENNGVYGLTKGQFSASSDVGSKSKKGEANVLAPIDPILLGLSIGATFVARAFSGDKEQLVPILKAALSHRGFALVDVISPCVTFNDHEGSTKSYLHTRQHLLPATEADFVPHAQEIVAEIAPVGVTNVTMHDGSVLRFTRLPEDYDVTDRENAFAYLKQHPDEVVTGILFTDENVPDLHEMSHTPQTALVNQPWERLCPGALQLEQLQNDFR